jgi:hypothetical protein
VAINIGEGDHMALEGLYKTTRRMGIKTKSAGPWDEISKKEMGRFTDGVGGEGCGHYDTELDPFGYCRDEDCRYNRIVAAIKSGEAMMNKEGVLIWTPGIKIRED